MGIVPKYYRLRVECKILDKTFKEGDSQNTAALYRAIDKLSHKPEDVSIDSFEDTTKWGFRKGTVHTVEMDFLPDVSGVVNSFEKEKRAMYLLDTLRPQLTKIGLEVRSFKTDWSFM